jgi:hypothetical protein
MPEEGSFAARGRDEIPPDRVLPHPITSPSRASCSSIIASALPKASPKASERICLRAWCSTTKRHNVVGNFMRHLAGLLIDDADG